MQSPDLADEKLKPESLNPVKSPKKPLNPDKSFELMNQLNK